MAYQTELIDGNYLEQVENIGTKDAAIDSCLGQEEIDLQHISSYEETHFNFDEHFHVRSSNDDGTSMQVSSNTEELHFVEESTETMSKKEEKDRQPLINDNTLELETRKKDAEIMLSVADDPETPALENKSDNESSENKTDEVALKLDDIEIESKISDIVTPIDVECDVGKGLKRLLDDEELVTILPRCKRTVKRKKLHSFKQSTKARKSLKLPPAKKARVVRKPLKKILQPDSEQEQGRDPSKLEKQTNNTINIATLNSVIEASQKQNVSFGNYKTVCNMAFAKLRRGFFFKCLLHGCQFQSLVKESLLTHLLTKHADQKWNGFCKICSWNLQVNDYELQILDEYLHMNTHVESSTSQPVPDCTTSAISSNKAQKMKLLSSEPKSSVFNTPTSPHHTKAILKSTHVSSSERSLNLLSSTIVIPSSPSSSGSLTPPKNPSGTVVKMKDSFNPTVVPLMTSEILRPWLGKGAVNKKSPDLSKAMQTLCSLCSTYKCMSSTCSFFTTSAILFYRHLSIHLEFTDTDKENFLKCAYCEFSGMSIGHLMSHIDYEHVFDRYQCKYCFYRSCTDFNVLTHMNMFHQDEKRVIIECPEIKSRDLPSELMRVKSEREDNVPPIICVFCRGIFFVMETFSQHIANHEGNQKAKCIKCQKIATKKTLLAHLEECHQIGLYQCIYCIFGTNMLVKLSNHIANKHPSRMPWFCGRVNQKNPDGTLKYVSLIWCKLLMFELSFYFLQDSPSFIEATGIKNLKQIVNKKFIIEASSDLQLLENAVNVGNVEEGFTIKSLEVKKISPKVTAGCSLLGKPRQQKIAAQMPMEPCPSISITGNLLKPLKIKNF